MELEDLKDAYGLLSVSFADDFTLKRAIFYYEFVRQAHEYLEGAEFKEALNTISDGGYDKVDWMLVLEGGLLNSLCKILDEYLVPAVNLELKHINYENYFHMLLEDARQEGKSVRSQFLPRFLEEHSNTNTALSTLTENFKKNILSACIRILRNWDLLRRMFSPDNNLKTLIGIQPTGSDFHKGGQQVLILKFSIRGQKTLRIVYKPSDMEVDCLIIGDTEAVNKVWGEKFQTNSLMELLNKSIKGNPLLEVLPTYKILPINPGSRMTETNGELPIRDSYGYIEYLSHDDEDYKVGEENMNKVGRRFYTLLGQLTALASLFAFSDLHVDNLIAHKYRPYLIDLENSLTRPVRDVYDTEIIEKPAVSDVGLAPAGTPHLGAIDGYASDERVYRVTDDSIIGRLVLKPTKNRLWTTPPETLISLTDYRGSLLSGFENMFDVIDSVSPTLNSALLDWFDRITSAVVRIVPLPTNEFRRVLEEAFSKDSNYKEEIASGMEESLKKGCDLFTAGKITQPMFLCLREKYVKSDLCSLDVPVFYHRLNTTEVMDSHGKQVEVPKMIKVGDDDVNIRELLKRKTFFRARPIDDVMENQQRLLANPSRLISQLTTAPALGDRNYETFRNEITDRTESENA